MIKTVILEREKIIAWNLRLKSRKIIGMPTIPAISMYARTYILLKMILMSRKRLTGLSL
jgi:hypothetical protein